MSSLSVMDKGSLQRRYSLDINLYERTYQKWVKRSKDIIKRYRDDRKEASQNSDDGAKFNILWSNVQTVMPAVFSRLPKPDVTRRYKDKDPVGRVASTILERCLKYEIEQYTDYESALQNCVEDRLLPGRGIAWVRYEPVMKSVQMPTDQPMGGEQVTEDVEEAPTADVIDYECTPVDYVNWEDFGHNVARTWEEVYLVWRIVPMDRNELIKRFGKEVGSKVPLDMKADLEDETLSTPEGESLKKARIYELWDKKEKIVVWLSKSMTEVVEAKPDTLELEGFFPCPKPIYATTTTGTLVPVPDFVLYQDQARELDLLCERIDGLIKAIKVVGLYDATQDSIKRLMLEGVNNTLIPVDTWAMFAEKGGIKGVIDWLPLDQVVGALNAAYVARDQIKAVIYEVTGIADIIRGSSDPNETLGAQQLKGQFASLRLKRLQGFVAKFATEILRIKAQIICQHYQPESIAMISGVREMPEEDQQYVPEAIALLRNDPMRCFRIEISSDSLLEVDEQQEKQDRIEFMTAVGGFIGQAMQAPPELAPLLGEMLLFGVRGFKAGNTLEGTFEETIETLKQKAAQPKEDRPNPEMMKLQMQQQIEQAKIQGQQQMDAMRNQMEAEREQQRMQMEMALEQQRAQLEIESEERKAAVQMQFDAWKAQMEAQIELMKAEISKQTTLDAAQIAASEVGVDSADGGM